jgi:hypothetical protein
MRLPLDVDVERLASEVAGLERDFARIVPGPFDVKGWDGISLVMGDGRADDTRSPFPSRTGSQPTPALERCPRHAELLSALGAPILAARLLYLERGGNHGLHRDPIGFPVGGIRIHLPLVTHPDAEMWLGGERMRWGAGELWYADFAFPHRLANPSPVMRIHLVLDVCITDALLDLFPSELVPDLLARGVCRFAPVKKLARSTLARFEGRWHLPRRLLVAVPAPEDLIFSCSEDEPNAIVARGEDGSVAFVLDPIDERTLTIRGYYPGVTFELGDAGGLELVHRGRVHCEPEAENDERTPWELFTSKSPLEPR